MKVKRIVRKTLGIKSPLDQYQFNIEVVNADEISGWAYKNEQPEHVPNIEIVSEHKVIHSTPANIYREDLDEANIGNGRFGFNFDLSVKVIPEGVKSFDIFIDGLKANSSSFSSKSKNILDKSLEKKPLRDSINEEAKVASANLVFQLDYQSVEKFLGWARDESQPENRSSIELVSEGVVIGSCVADQYREDLEKAKIGDGSHGFQLVPQLHRFPKNEINCDILVDGLKVDIEPIILSTTKQEIERAVFEREFSKEIAEMTSSFDDELTRITTKVREFNKANANQENSVDGVLNVTLHELSELTVRVSNLEKILVRYFNKNNG